MSKEKFTESINKSYSLSGSTIFLGAGIFNGEIIPEAKVNLSLRMMTRHGLVTEKSSLEQVMSSPISKQIGKEIVRGVFGMLFGTSRRRRY
jgi:hypothetical protein